MPIRPRLAAVLLVFISPLIAQTPTPLDPTRNLPANSSSAHTPLPEQYIWTANDITVNRPDRSKFSWSRTDLRIEPHYFLTHFQVATLPTAATLYIAGPRQAHVYLNGQLIGDFIGNTDAPINFRVFHAEATHALKLGENTLAIEAIRGTGVVSGAGPIATQQLAYGEALAAKIVPAPFGTEAPALVISNQNWRSSPTLTEHWQQPTFDDHTWPTVASLGPIESNIDLLQWSADAGMYDWPGYMGMSPWLRTYSLQPAAITHIYPGHSTLTNLESLTASSPSAKPFTITLPNTPTDAEAPQFLIDFGREVAGRLLVESACNCVATLSIAYGESEIEAMSTGLTTGQRGGNYLGTNLLDVPANGIARGPKSAFRYVRITFLRGAPTTAFKSLRLEGIYYPVEYKASFESSDPLLNRIWETGAYTAHLCMQDGIWDAPKRDRGRWIGDIDVEGRVISTVFADKFLLEDTIRRLAEATPPNQHVNGISGYTALWITSLQSLYQHTGDQEFLTSQHATLLRLLTRLDQDLDANHLLSPSSKGWGFVDWAPGFYGTTPDTRIGTNLQYLRAYQAAVPLLKALGDDSNAAKYADRTNAIATAAKQAYLDPATRTIGTTWQLNTLAVLDHLAPQDDHIWSAVLSHVKQDSPTDQVISPYFNAYLLDAMASLNHRHEALDWVRTYWGGMLAEGATSFWESYDLRWPKTNYHLSLEADGTSGYFVSLAHGWSSGPTAWLSENLLGITPLEPGYRKVSIRPDLMGLDWAKGSVPTPHGLITISIDKKKGIELDLPTGIESASLVITPTHPGDQIYLNGKLTPCTTCSPEQPTRTLELTSPGHYSVSVSSHPPSDSSAAIRTQ